MCKLVNEMVELSAYKQTGKRQINKLLTFSYTLVIKVSVYISISVPACACASAIPTSPLHVNLLFIDLP